MSELTDPPGIAALAAGGTALVALLWALVLTVQVRRLRRAQRVVLGDEGSQDLVGHAAGLQQAFLGLRDWVEEMAGRLDQRMGTAEERLDGALAHRALVRYDAYGELSGHQSTSIALLDAGCNGVVLSSIAHRDSARLYCKQVVDGKGLEIALSPEEDEAVRLAMAGDAGPRTLDQA